VSAVQFRRFAKRLLWLYLPTLLFLVFVLLPFYWMAITSFKQDRNIFDPKANPFWFNMAPTLKHYINLINPDKTDFLIWVQNSLMVAALVTVISVTISIMAGYSLARLRYKGQRALGHPCSLPTWCQRRCCSCPWPMSSGSSGSWKRAGPW